MMWDQLNATIIQCCNCPRLVDYREHVPKRKSFQDETYWRKPVPGFGDHHAELLILGLAPAANGGNRTGRIFTGDPSGDFLMQVLFDAGFANQPHSHSLNDGLKLNRCFITAVVKCAPPLNKPLPSEFAACHSYFENEFFLLSKAKAVLALGKEAFDRYQRFIKHAPRSPFSHGKKVAVDGWPPLYGSYHPSPQNTYTKKLTYSLMFNLLDRIKKEACILC